MCVMGKNFDWKMLKYEENQTRKLPMFIGSSEVFLIVFYGELKFYALCKQNP